MLSSHWAQTQVDGDEQNCTPVHFSPWSHPRTAWRHHSNKITRKEPLKLGAWFVVGSKFRTHSIVQEKINLGFGISQIPNIQEELLQESSWMLNKNGHRHLGIVFHLQSEFYIRKWTASYPFSTWNLMNSIGGILVIPYNTFCCAMKSQSGHACS